MTLSWYHMQFPGSMRLSTTTFLQVFREVCDSLVHHGFENLIAVNGHGGNIAALTVAVNHTSRRRGAGSSSSSGGISPRTSWRRSRAR